MTSPARPRARRPPDPLWYKDAILYELHVRAYMDGVGDGTGDFTGLAQKLDYLQDLGITAIWLLPFYPSPLKDDGYDTADYTDVHPAYGTMRDFRAFLKEAHRRARWNHGCWSEVWFMTRSVTIRMPRAWACETSSMNSGRVPNSGSTAW